MKILEILLLAGVLCVSSTSYNLDQSSLVTLTCDKPTILTISSSPSSGYLWYSPSTEYIQQLDSFGDYNSGFQQFKIRCAEEAKVGSTYGINFYYVDATYNMIYTHQVSVYIH